MGWMRAIMMTYDTLDELPAIPGMPDLYTYAIGNMNNTWWVNWSVVEKIAALPRDVNDAKLISVIMMAQLLLAARGNLAEVTREQADAIAQEYGAKL